LVDGHGRVTVTVSDSHSDSDELAGYAAMLCYEPYYESMNTTSHTATPLLHNTTQYKTRWMLCVSNVMCVSISCCIAIAASLHRIASAPGLYLQKTCAPPRRILYKHLSENATATTRLNSLFQYQSFSVSLLARWPLACGLAALRHRHMA